jgi:hypothetical protein
LEERVVEHNLDCQPPAHEWAEAGANQPVVFVEVDVLVEDLGLVDRRHVEPFVRRLSEPVFALGLGEHTQGGEHGALLSLL